VNHGGEQEMVINCIRAGKRRALYGFGERNKDCGMVGKGGGECLVWAECKFHQAIWGGPADDKGGG